MSALFLVYVRLFIHLVVSTCFCVGQINISIEVGGQLSEGVARCLKETLSSAYMEKHGHKRQNKKLYKIMNIDNNSNKWIWVEGKIWSRASHIV